MLRIANLTPSSEVHRGPYTYSLFVCCIHLWNFFCIQSREWTQCCQALLRLCHKAWASDKPANIPLPLAHLVDWFLQQGWVFGALGLAARWEMSLHGASGVTDEISANCGLIDSKFEDSACLAGERSLGDSFAIGPLLSSCLISSYAPVNEQLRDNLTWPVETYGGRDDSRGKFFLFLSFADRGLLDALISAHLSIVDEIIISPYPKSNDTIVDALVAKQFFQPLIFSYYLLGTKLNLFGRLNALIAGLSQSLLQTSDVVFLSCSIPALILS